MVLILDDHLCREQLHTAASSRPDEISLHPSQIHPAVLIPSISLVQSFVPADEAERKSKREGVGCPFRMFFHRQFAAEGDMDFSAA